MEVAYQLMGQTELAELLDFAAPIWRECYRETLPSGQIELLIHRYFDYSNILKYQRDGMIYEYILFNGQRAGFTAYKPNGAYVYLDKLYLLEQFRSLHISSHVFDDLSSRYQKPLRLNVNQGNTLGLRAYQGRGFQVIATKRYDLPGGYVNQDYVMEKPYRNHQDRNKM